MTNGNFEGSLNQVSNDLIQMHVAELFNRINMSDGNESIRKLSDADKKRIKESVESLKTQTEAFLADQQNKKDAVQPNTGEVIQQLQEIQSNQDHVESEE